MLCDKGFFEKRCAECKKRYIVSAETHTDNELYFCFATYDGAKRCFDMIESTNEYAGFQFIPKTAVLLKPQ